MKRSEFLKRLGLGLGAAVAAPSLLAKEKEFNYTDKCYEFTTSANKRPDLAFNGSINKSDLVFSITDINGDYVDLESASVSMQIKGNVNEIYLKNGDGLTVNGNGLNLNRQLLPGEYDYEMIIDNELASKGKLRV